MDDGAVFFLLVWIVASCGILAYFGFANNRRVQEAQQARIRAIDFAAVDTMNGIAFEHYIAELLRHEGYSDVAVSKASGDFGVDIVACRYGKRYAIQVKRYTGTVSRRAVSDAVAGMSHYGCNAAMVITNSYLSGQSMAFAAKLGCEIVNRDRLGEWILRRQSSSLRPQTAVPVNTLRQSIPEPITSHAQYAPRVLSVDTQTHSSAKPSEPEKPKQEATAHVPNWSDLPSDVLDAIKARAQESHPRNFASQAYLVEANVDAYRSIQTFRHSTVPNYVVEEIKSRVLADHQADYRTQLYRLENDAKAFIKLDRMTGFAVPDDIVQGIKEDAARDYPGDYSTQLYVVNGQVRAYRTLHQA